MHFYTIASSIQRRTLLFLKIANTWYTIMQPFAVSVTSRRLANWVNCNVRTTCTNSSGVKPDLGLDHAGSAMVDCKTAVFFANASDGPYSNERLDTRGSRGSRLRRFPPFVNDCFAIYSEIHLNIMITRLLNLVGHVKTGITPIAWTNDSL